MTGEQITTLFERLGRLVGATKHKAGDGSTWDYTFPDGETHRYVIRGLKSHAEAEDSAFNLIIWIWNAKDYLKQRAPTLGRPGRIVEDAVNVAPALTVCADLAHRLKHGDLRASRSGRYPRLGVVSFTAPQPSIGALTFKAFEVELEIAEPALVEFSLPVVDQNGGEIGDAFDIAGQALSILEEIKVRLEYDRPGK